MSDGPNRIYRRITRIPVFCHVRTRDVCAFRSGFSPRYVSPAPRFFCPLPPSERPISSTYPRVIDKFVVSLPVGYGWSDAFCRNRFFTRNSPFPTFFSRGAKKTKTAENNSSRDVKMLILLISKLRDKNLIRTTVFCKKKSRWL